MKKTRFRMMLIAAVAAFALLFAGADRLQAQTDSDDPFTLPTGNFVTPGQAVVILTTHVANLKVVLSTLIPGTEAYTTLDRSVAYYHTIQVGVENGKDIPNSILEGLVFAQGYRSDFALPEVSNVAGAGITELIGLREDAIELLSQ